MTLASIAATDFGKASHQKKKSPHGEEKGLRQSKKTFERIGVRHEWLRTKKRGTNGLRHQDCPIRMMGIIREFAEIIEQLLQSRSMVQYPKIEPFLHGAIFAANPYLKHFMEHINYEYLRWSTISRVSLCTLADEMACAAYGTYQYNDYMSNLKRQAKKLNCSIEELREQGDEWVYDVEL